MDKNTTSLISTLEEFYKKAPVLPTSARDVIVRFTPVLSLVFGILGILIGIVGFLSLTVLAPLALMVNRYGTGYGNGFVSSLTLVVSSAFLLAAYPAVKAHKFRGWELLFWSEIATVVGSLIQFDIISAIIGGLIGFYILFQIKSYYK